MEIHTLELGKFHSENMQDQIDMEGPKKLHKPLDDVSDKKADTSRQGSI